MQRKDTKMGGFFNGGKSENLLAANFGRVLLNCNFYPSALCFDYLSIISHEIHFNSVGELVDIFGF
jgi:hypothetical protein